MRGLLLRGEKGGEGRWEKSGREGLSNPGTDRPKVVTSYVKEERRKDHLILFFHNRELIILIGISTLR